MELSESLSHPVTIPIRVYATGDFEYVNTLAAAKTLTNPSMIEITIPAGSSAYSSNFDNFFIRATADADSDHEFITLEIDSASLPAGVALGQPARQEIGVKDAQNSDTPTVHLSVAKNPIPEGEPLIVRAVLSSVLPHAVEIPLTTTNGSAQDEDYDAPTTITISLRSLDTPFQITTAPDADTLDETFTLALGTLPAGVTAGAPASVPITIIDDDGDGTLVSTMGQAGGAHLTAGGHVLAQGFTTGAAAGGYTLSSIEVVLDLNATPAQRAASRAQLWSATAGGAPDAKLADLRVPSSVRAGVVSFAAPANTRLLSSTTYHLVLYTTDDTDLGPGPTAADAEDATSQPGWSIADYFQSQGGNAPTSAAWTPDTESFRMRVTGATLPFSPPDTVWSARLNPSGNSYSGIGCGGGRPSCEGQLSDDTITYGGAESRITLINGNAQNLQINVSGAPLNPILAHLSHFCIESRRIPIRENAPTNLVWHETGQLDWQQGTPVNLKIAKTCAGDTGTGGTGTGGTGTGGTGTGGTGTGGTGTGSGSGSGGGGGGGGGGTDTDRHGDTPDEATTLNPRRYTTGAFSRRIAAQFQRRRDVDYFRLDLPYAGVLTASTTGRLDTTGRLYQAQDEGDPLLVAEDRRLGRAFRLGEAVAPGVYYLAVSSGGSIRGDYTLRTHYTPAFAGNPAPHSPQSGVSVLSGWVCDADTVEIEFETPGAEPQTWVPATGTSRPDTASHCGPRTTDTGYGLLFNWNRLGDGQHTVRVIMDDVVLAEREITVTTLGPHADQEFRRDLAATTDIPDFPDVGETTTLRWQTARQNFMIASGTGGGDGQQLTPEQAWLGNPAPGSFQSGVGVLSGWVCEANTVELVFETATGTTFTEEAGYGTERGTRQGSVGIRTMALACCSTGTAWATASIRCGRWRTARNSATVPLR